MVRNRESAMERGEESGLCLGEGWWEGAEPLGDLRLWRWWPRSGERDLPLDPRLEIFRGKRAEAVLSW